MAYIDWVDHGMQAVGLLPPPMPEGNGQSGAAPLYVGTAPLIFSLDDIASDPAGNPEQHPDILPVSLR